MALQGSGLAGLWAVPGRWMKTTGCFRLWFYYDHMHRFLSYFHGNIFSHLIEEKHRENGIPEHLLNSFMTPQGEHLYLEIGGEAEAGRSLVCFCLF